MAECFLVSSQNVGIHQEEGNHTDGEVADSGKLCKGGLFGIPAEGQADQQNVNDGKVDAEGPNQTVLERTHRKEDNEDQADGKEVSHHLFIATFKEEESNDQPEQAEEGKDSA